MTTLTAFNKEFVENCVHVVESKVLYICTIYAMLLIRLNGAVTDLLDWLQTGDSLKEAQEQLDCRSEVWIKKKKKNPDHITAMSTGLSQSSWPWRWQTFNKRCVEQTGDMGFQKWVCTRHRGLKQMQLRCWVALWEL